MTTVPTAALPQSCLQAADQLLTSVVRGTRGAWPRACAWLLRLALEAAMDDYWLRLHPEVAGLRARSPQFLILDRYAGRHIAARAGYAWAALSRAGHHHCYELGLTAGELRRLREMVAAVVSDLAAERVPRPGGSVEDPSF
ncbi:hypothetical protein DKT69_23235 [Micromonospora sicca]|uniref:Uncharacterized protein n=1 Tax=Micromonospora sicca TaxID=2202420 RepID=A0A317DEE4_9ACTN|nr:hypothetical protein [Micromonospora sp. 4G51]PWR12672.1 hypothetical protein DKT69_23235 [Micromonospora sp. 4G51]